MTDADDTPSNRYWPLAGLRLRVRGAAATDVGLRALTESDMTTLADVLPDDVDLDPSIVPVSGAIDQVTRGTALHQTYWRAVGSWQVDAWVLPFGVWADGELVGMQGLEGTHFPRLRTVDSYSWLITPARGHGIGSAARRAVLALAFGPLRARAAVTSAWHDNHASLAVSRSLGYAPNGSYPQARGAGADEMVHLRLDRDRWLASGGAPDVEIAGFAPCRRFFEHGPVR